MANCKTHHVALCGSPCQPSWLPTRLIDIGDSASAAAPRLVGKEEVASFDCAYVALSYYSTEMDFTSLNTSNIELFRTDLPLMDLPILFHYAIVATKMLGYRYLWVDVLCVIQDSQHDMLSEMPTIGLVYQHCALNIAATSAEDVHQHLALGCSAGPIPPCEIAFSDGDLKKPCFFRYNAVPENIWRSGLRQTRLGRHAAFFQDQLCPPRTLHLGKEIYWECRGLKACESAPHGLPDRMIRDPSNENIGDKDLRLIKSSPNTSTLKSYNPPDQQLADRWHEAWRLVVSEYTGSVIPNPTLTSRHFGRCSGISRGP